MFAVEVARGKRAIHNPRGNNYMQSVCRLVGSIHWAFVGSEIAGALLMIDFAEFIFRD